MLSLRLPAPTRRSLGTQALPGLGSRRCPRKARGLSPKRDKGQFCRLRQPRSWLASPACPDPLPRSLLSRSVCPGCNRDSAQPQRVVSSIPSLSPTPLALKPIPTYTEPPAKTATLKRRKKKKAVISVRAHRTRESSGWSRAPRHSILHLPQQPWAPRAVHIAPQLGGHGSGWG